MDPDTLDGYFTHAPLLAAMMLLTKGPVLECGVGYYSTPMLNLMCHIQDRRLVSMDRDAIWIEKIKGALGGPVHETIWVPPHLCSSNGWDASVFPEGDFTLALVDSGPTRARRGILHWLIDRVDFVILHDGRNKDRWFSEIKHWKRFDFLRPPTIIASNKYEIPSCL